ncbi:MAG: CCA tRNA nucleotidyltransferase [Rhodospirillaceae bacterium]
MDRQPWMTVPEVARIFEVLGAPDVDVRFVGGCVRNAVMGLRVGDLDLATPEPPQKVIDRLSVAQIKVVPTGLEHGTITAVLKNASFEITTLRRDTACDGRHADVEFTTDWHEDARRRDFTVNAMSMRPDGTLFDDHGGLEDARAGRIRFVGTPEDRIQEDYLRILRLFRFFAWYGREPVDEEALSACRKHVRGLNKLSAERVQQELTKLLAAKNPVPALLAMSSAEVLRVVLPESQGTDVLQSLVELESEAATFPTDWVRRLAALVPSGAAESIAERLRLSAGAAKRLVDLCERANTIEITTLNRLLYKAGAALAADRILLSWAQARAESPDEDPEPWRNLIEIARSWTPRTLPVTGRDVLALGISPGPDVGKYLTAVEDWWIEAKFSPSRDDVLDELRRRVKDA